MPRDTLKYESRILAFATSQLICKNGNFAIRKVKLDFPVETNLQLTLSYILFTKTTNFETKAKFFPYMLFTKTKNFETKAKFFP